MPQKRPNIILIVLDTLRPDHLSCYGYRRPTSPNLDKIAAEGALFKRCFSTAPWTLPSHGSLFTGTYLSRHGLDKGNEKLSEDFVTMAEFLKEEGYFTAGFSSNIWVSPMTGLSRGFEYFKSAKEIPYINVKQLNVFQKVIKDIYLRYLFKRYDFGAREINSMLKKFFNRTWREEKPFFIFINYLETHLKYSPPRQFRNLFLNKVQQKKANQVNQDAPKFNAGRISMSEEDFEILTALYDAEIRYVDFRLGEFISHLRELKILDDTFLIITSDHGENLGDHNLMDHQYSLHDTLLHVPLIIRYPEIFKAGTTIDDSVQLVDFLPMIAELLDCKNGSFPVEQVQGKSFLNKQNKQSRDLFAEYLNPRMQVLERNFPDGDWSAFKRKLRAIRTDDFKFIHASDGGNLLYDLANDPLESTNVISEYPQEADKLARRLDEWTKAAASSSSKRSEFELQEDARRVLEGLGYI